MLPLFKLGLGGRMGRGKQWMSWIHRDDLLGIILLCLSNPAVRGAVNGTAPIPVTNRVFAKTDRKSTRLNSSHVAISYAVFCLKKKNLSRFRSYSDIVSMYLKKRHNP